MDWDIIQGNWKQLKGKLREQWGLLTDDDIEKAAGRREQLEGIIQERYGISKDENNSMSGSIRSSFSRAKGPLCTATADLNSIFCAACSLLRAISYHAFSGDREFYKPPIPQMIAHSS
jgi:uncharacterized protein YjbJ (UPF0337 family)